MRGIAWAALAGTLMQSATVLGLTWTSAPVRAQTLSDWKCTGHLDISWDKQIVGCTNAIKSGRYTAKNLAAAFEGRGNAYFGMGDYDHAIADYTATIRLDPKGAYAFYDRGAAYQVKGAIDHAIADYTEAIRLDPNYVKAFNNRGAI